MKKTYTKPEIEVSKFDVETVVTTNISGVGVDLTAQIYNNGSKTAVAVVDYTKIFAK
ncbi:MAG: hypothetical protein IJ300_06525 [Clostridia bacterium]|nr:hypothetical protein [Clostridia bacterium]